MSSAQDHFQQAMAAFQAGDRQKASELFQRVVQAEPNNEQAWYYLAAAQTDNALRKQYLRRVLELNPNNARAREVLLRLEARDGVEAPAAPLPPDDAPPIAPKIPPQRTSPIRSLGGSTPPGGAKASDPGFALPFTIPGAPVKVSLQSLAQDGFDLFKTGLEVWQRRPAVFEGEYPRATWWRFWLLVGFGAVISGAFFVLSLIVFELRLAGIVPRYTFDVLAILIGLLFYLPIALATFYAACYASHWWAVNQGKGVASLVQHSYTSALVWVPVLVITSAISFALSLLGLGGLSLINLIIAIYGLYALALDYDLLHHFRESNQKWMTMAAFVLAYLVVGFLIGALLGGIAGVRVLPFSF